jgi:hypothetical protein
VPDVRLLEDGRSIMLLRDFTYIDHTGRHWTVDEGFIADGASIPRFFWRFIGPPLTGRYRYASIIHDYFCAIGEEVFIHWKDVHWLFYEAMLASGVGPKRAWAMWKAVDRFGPRWPADSIHENYFPEAKK